MSIPLFQFIPLPTPTFPPWCPYVCSLHLCLYFCPANWFICTIFLGSTYKDKEKLLKAAREKRQITYKGIPIRLTADLSAETLQARRDWQDVFKVMKEKNLQPRLLCPARISFRFDGEIKSFTDKQNLREFSTTKPVLQQMLKELL